MATKITILISFVFTLLLIPIAFKYVPNYLSKDQTLHKDFLTEQQNNGTESNNYYEIISSCQNCVNATYTATLLYNGKEQHIINETNKVINKLNFSYCFYSPDHLTIRIIDPNSNRYEVPKEYPYPHNDENQPCLPLEQTHAIVSITVSPFSFKVTRTKSGEVLFDLDPYTFQCSEWYMALKTTIPTNNIYGLGERAAQFDLGKGGKKSTYTLFSKDQFCLLDPGERGYQRYSFHPVYLQRESQGHFHMNYFRTSHAMDVTIENKTLKYEVLGGIFEFNFFLSRPSDYLYMSPGESAIKLYHSWIGGWVNHPLWSFGHHQCRYGYQNVGELRGVLENYTQNNLPLDALWTDIDALDSNCDFTFDQQNFPPNEMRALYSEYQKRYVPIIDYQVGVHNNPYYEKAKEGNFLLTTPDGQYANGTCWPGEVNYPDFRHPNTSSFWKQGMKDQHDMVPYDGVWIDMNEPANNLYRSQYDWMPNMTDFTNRPVFNPSREMNSFYSYQVRMDAINPADGTIHYHTHNIDNLEIARVVYESLKELDKGLPFLPTRSTSPGSQRFAVKWTGDTSSNEDWMYVALPYLMDFNLFGIPMVGADVCGFNGMNADTGEELCARWYQSATLYPFSRNQNNKLQIDHSPYAMGPTLTETARITLQQRYSLIKYMYSIFLSKNGTGTVFRPAFLSQGFSNDEKFYEANQGMQQHLEVLKKILFSVFIF